MTAMAGGAADKAGNQYEHLWTALRIADLLTGSATRLRPEPPGSAGQGIEFEIDQDGETWGEQVKGSLSANNWDDQPSQQGERSRQCARPDPDGTAVSVRVRSLGDTAGHA